MVMHNTNISTKQINITQNLQKKCPEFFKNIKNTLSQLEFLNNQSIQVILT